MGKGANKQLLSNSGVAQSESNQKNAQAEGTFNFLDPQLKAEATNPQGYTPQQLAYMNTASQQSLGGGVSATTGQANLETARNRNSGGFEGAIGEANRGAQRQLSQNALQVQTNQANLQQAQRQQALQSLQSLYGVDQGTALGYLDTSNKALGAEGQTSGANSLLGKSLLASIQAAGQAGAAAAGKE